jgi:hypothetical protein
MGKRARRRAQAYKPPLPKGTAHSALLTGLVASLQARVQTFVTFSDLEQSMIKGTVDSWSISTGTGTIVAEDGGSWSFRGEDIIESEQAMPGAKVEFAPSENAGKVASTIRVVRRVDVPIDVIDAVPNL